MASQITETEDIQAGGDVTKEDIFLAAWAVVKVFLLKKTWFVLFVTVCLNTLVTLIANVNHNGSRGV